MSTVEILFWATQFWIWASTLTSVGIMIPQVINLHKNKYADNSSILTYWIYMMCNLFWTIYQVLFIIYASIDPSQQLSTGMYVILYIQLGSDIISTSIGIYLIILKSYYVHKIKTNKELQAKHSNIEQIRANINFLEKNIHYIDDQFTVFYQYDKNLCEKYIKVPKKSKLNKYNYFIKELSQDKKATILSKIANKIFKNLNETKIVDLYEKVDKINDSFINQYKKDYNCQYNNLIENINHKQKNNFDLSKLSYEKKLRISFVIVYNLQNND